MSVADLFEENLRTVTFSKKKYIFPQKVQLHFLFKNGNKTFYLYRVASVNGILRDIRVIYLILSFDGDETIVITIV